MFNIQMQTSRGIIIMFSETNVIMIWNQKGTAIIIVSHIYSFNQFTWRIFNVQMHISLQLSIARIICLDELSKIDTKILYRTRIYKSKIIISAH